MRVRKKKIIKYIFFMIFIFCISFLSGNLLYKIYVSDKTKIKNSNYNNIENNFLRVKSNNVEDGEEKNSKSTENNGINNSLEMEKLNELNNIDNLSAKDGEKDKELDNNSDKLRGYNVIAKINIPKIGLNTEVLSEYSEEALKVSTTKFYGAGPNEIGNFCVSGHNYKKSNMFSKLKNVSVGDEINVTDNKDVTIKYKVYDTFKVDPKDTKCLSQKTNGKKEITLITCTTNSKLRIIVKAVQI